MGRKVDYSDNRKLAQAAKKRNAKPTANTKTTTKPKSLQTNNVSAANNTPKRKPKRKSTQIVEQNKNDIGWNKNLQKLINYKKKNKHTIVRKNEDKQLSKWVYTQRCKKKKLEKSFPERFVKLNAIDFVWDNYIFDTEWTRMYNNLIVYKNKHNQSFRVPRTQAYPGLCNWVNNQRSRNEGLSKARIAKLDAIGFVW